MFEYLSITDFQGQPTDIIANGSLNDLGAKGWEYCHMQNSNGRREWLFKRYKAKAEEPKKRGRPKKVKDAA